MRRKALRVLAGLLIGATAIVLGGQPGSACSYTEEAVQEARAAADLVFVGVPVRPEETLTTVTGLSGILVGGDGYTDWTFEVEQVIRGTVESPLKVRSRATSVGVQSTCSIGFTAGKRYLVYATKSPDGTLRPTVGTTPDPPFVFSPTTTVPPAKPVPVRRPNFTG